MFEAKHLAGAAERGLHFVGDKDRTAFLAPGRQSLHPFLRWDVATPAALIALYDDGGDIALGFRFGKPIQVIQAVRGVAGFQRLAVLYPGPRVALAFNTIRKLLVENAAVA